MINSAYVLYKDFSSLFSDLTLFAIMCYFLFGYKHIPRKEVKC